MTQFPSIDSHNFSFGSGLSDLGGLEEGISGLLFVIVISLSIR